MARATPTIHDMTLHYYVEGQPISIAVESTHWFEWLHEETSTIFSIQTIAGSYTARKERAGSRRGGWYWKAYRTYQGTLYRAYLGKSEDLTLARLLEMARTLSARIHEQQALPQADIPHNQEPGEAIVTPLLETRLHPPRLPVLLVERPHLLARLDRGEQQKLIVLQAPAGFGKTTLVTQWLAHRQATQSNSVSSISPSEQNTRSKTAWISLDSGDNDPIRFWSSLIAACQTLQVEIGQRALAQLAQISHGPSASFLENALTFLLNDLAAHSVQEGVLILEDYHLIEHERIHETLTFFIEHLPTSLHMMILTRVEPPLPLVRWRARGDLLEISGNQLRFSPEETATFLQQTMPQAFFAEAGRTLHEHLEGWPAGMRLLALNLQNHMTPQTIEDALKQLRASTITDRTHRSIQEYFLSEVLNAQPEPLQRFLLQTSMLSRLSGSLCNAVMERSDSARWLDMLERSGFFLEALDNTGQWYRYHALFAETMYNEASRRLGTETLRQLSALASRWYEDHSLLVEAIEAALSAGELERTAQLIEKLHEITYFSEYHTLRRWLEQLPDSILRTHPALCFRFAQARLFPEDMDSSSWKIARVERLLQMAEEEWRRQGNLPRVGSLYAFRATYMLLEGHFASAVKHANLALQLIPLGAEQSPTSHIHGRHDWRCICLLALGMEMMQEGSFDRARQHLLEAYTLCLNDENSAFQPVISRSLGDVCVELGELHQAASYYQRTRAEAIEQDNEEKDFVQASALAGLARLAYIWNDLDTAERLAHEASKYRDNDRFPRWEGEIRTRADLLALRVLQVRGEDEEVKSALSALLTRLQTNAQTFPLSADILTWQARLQISDGDFLSAERILGTHANTEHELSQQQQQAIYLVHARLLLAKGEARTALSLLERLLAFAQQGQHLSCALEIQILIALAHAALKEGPEARQQLSLVLSLARNEGFIRIFLDEGEPLAALIRSLLPSLKEKHLHTFAQRILHAFTNHPSALAGSESSLIEPLSTQEQRVLTLLVVGRSNPEIAQELIVSVNTVKAHLKNLYRKLGVTNRMEAGEVARREKLISR
jgi:LuxR family maltose regulon positive regulatory protein